MSVPKVAIVGRPNVGKSSIFNWLAGHQIAVVDHMAGVTRDRVMHLVHHKDRYFELVDTGGLGIFDDDGLSEDIEGQIRIGIEEAHLILFVVDGRMGASPLDTEVAELLRPVQTPRLLVVNKCDSIRHDGDVHEFHRLSDAPLVITSVKGNRNRKELLEAILKHLPKAEADEATSGQRLSEQPELKLAIVGRRNVGKSTFINALAETERMIVSEVAGTTRDSVDVRFELDEKSFIAIDTPGVRKQKSLANNVEFYGFTRAKRSIRRASVVLMFFDSQQRISKVDKQLVREIERHSKPCVFVVNKWDLAEDMETESWADYLFETFASMRHVPIAFITAMTGRNVKKLINLTQTIYKQSRIRVGTGRLNKVLRAAVTGNPPPFRKNKRPKIYFGTQIGTEPPTLVVKCNDASLFDPAWKRYLLGVLREELPFHEVPIKLYLRSKGQEEKELVSLEEAKELPEFDDD